MHGLVRRTYRDLEHYRFHHPKIAAERSAEHFQDRARIAVHGRKTWGKHGPPYHAHLIDLGIKHHWDDTKREAHNWESGWVGPIVDALVAMTANSEGVSE